MLYSYNITIPADTSNSSPKTQKLTLLAGKITKIGVKFPSGCHAMVNVRFTHKGTAIAPSGESIYITGDDEEVVAELDYELPANAKEIYFYGSSPSTTYDHIVQVRITLSIVTPSDELLTLVKRISVALDTEWIEPKPTE